MSTVHSPLDSANGAVAEEQTAVGRPVRVEPTQQFRQGNHSLRGPIAQLALRRRGGKSFVMNSDRGTAASVS
jgi:hypothetical protein